MDRTVYLHLGHGRCGSSSIQQFGEAKRDELGRRGVLYPSALEMGFSPQEAKGGNGRALIFAESRETAIERAVAYVTASDAPRVLISAEQFMAADPALHHGLADALRDAGLRVVGVFYVRDQREWLVSRWAQALKSNRWTVTLQEWVDKHLASPSRLSTLDYAASHRRFTDVFGAEHLIVRRFQPDALTGGDVRLDLFGLLGIDVADLIEDEPTANASASIDEVVAMRVLNTLPRGPMFNPRPFLRYAGNYAALQGWEREHALYRLVAPEQMRAVRDHYAPSNEKLRAMAFSPGTPSPVLACSIPDDYEPVSEDDVVSTRSMTLVASFLTWYGDRVRKRAEAEAG